MSNPTMAEVREALTYASRDAHSAAHRGEWDECLTVSCKGDRDLLARLDGMTILPTAEVERLRAGERLMAGRLDAALGRLGGDDLRYDQESFASGEPADPVLWVPYEALRAALDAPEPSR